MKEYKATFRFPTEQFAYMEVSAEGTPETLKQQYDEFKRILKVGIGLETKEFNQVLDNYRSGKGIAPDTHERMDEQQQWFLHELDKSNQRCKSKVIKTNKN